MDKVIQLICSDNVEELKRRFSTVSSQIVSNYGRSCLDKAVSPDMRQLLASAWPNDHPEKLHALIRADQIDEVVDAVAAGADVNAGDEQGRTPLHEAAAFNRVKHIDVLIEADADVDARDGQNFTPLLRAVEADGLDGAERLVAAGADVTACARSQCALDMAYTPEMRQLLARAWPQDHLLRLHALVKADLNDEVADAVAAGADLNARDVRGCSPLHWAAERSSLAAVQALLAAGADPNARDATKTTPLQRAVRNAKGVAVVEALLDAGADPNVQDADGQTPLHDAVWFDRADLAERLVGAGADVSTRVRGVPLQKDARSRDMRRLLARHRRCGWLGALWGKVGGAFAD